MRPRPKLFLSYAHEDREKAGALARLLESEGFSVLWDLDIRIGENFAAVIEQWLARVSAVVVLWSRRSIESQRVLAEANEALRDRKLIPVSLDASEPPLIFRQLKMLEFRDEDFASDSRAFRQLAGDLKSMAGALPARTESRAANNLLFYEGYFYFNTSLRRLVVEALKVSFGKSWWDQGVVKALGPEKVSQLAQNWSKRRRAQIDDGPSDDDLAEMLDVGGFLPILQKHWKRAFAGRFSERDKAEVWLKEIIEIRNQVMHPESSPVSKEDAYRGLDTMQRFLLLTDRQQVAQLQQVRDRAVPEVLASEILDDLGASYAQGLAALSEQVLRTKGRASDDYRELDDLLVGLTAELWRQRIAPENEDSTEDGARPTVLSRLEQLARDLTGKSIGELSTPSRRSPARLRAHVNRPLPDFHGRTKIIDEVIEAFEKDRGESEFVCLLDGMGGVGKTETAKHIINRLVHSGRFGDGHLRVDLRGSSNEPMTVEQALKKLLAPFHREESLPDSAEQLRRSWIAATAQGETVVLLDNAADEEQVEGLLTGHSNVATFITSRDRLAVPGAVTTTVEPMDLEEATELLLFLATRRNEQRLDAAGARSLAKLCGRLPLALRIAGNTLDCEAVLSVEDYRRALEDRSQRLGILRRGRRSVALTLSASLDLLQPELVHLWALLGVFAEGFDDQAVRSVGEREDVREELSRLHRRSLVLYDDELNRFRVHDLLADLALEYLEKDAVEAEHARLKHAQYYLEYLSELNAALGGGVEKSTAETLRELDLALGNILRAQQWCALRSADDTRAAWLAARLPTHGYLARRLEPKRHRKWLETARVAAARLRDRGAEATVLRFLGNNLRKAKEPTRRLANLEQAERLLKQALELAIDLGDEEMHAKAAGNLGMLYRDQERYDRSRSLIETSLRLNEGLEDQEGVATDKGNLALIHQAEGDWEGAERLLLESLAINESRRDQIGISSSCYHLGRLYARGGRLDEAESMFNRSFEESVELHETDKFLSTGRALCRLHFDARKGEEALRILRKCQELCLERKDVAGLPRLHQGILTWQAKRHREAGELVEAARLLKQLSAFLEELGAGEPRVFALRQLAGIYREQGQPALASERLVEALDLSRRVGSYAGEASVLVEVAQLSKASGDFERAESALFECQRLNEREEDERRLDKTRKQLVWLYVDWASAARRAGDLEQAERGFDRLRELNEERGDVVGQAKTEMQLALLERDRGDLEAAEGRLVQAVELNRNQDDRAAEAGSTAQLALIYRRMGDFEREAAAWQRCLELNESLDDEGMVVKTLSQQRSMWLLEGLAAREENRLAEAESAFEHLLAVNSRLGDAPGTVKTKFQLGLLRSRQDRITDAKAAFREVVASGPIGDSNTRAMAGGQLARLLQREGDFEEAHSVLTEALNITRDSGQPDLEVKFIVQLALLLRDAGDVEGEIAAWERCADLDHELHEEDLEVRSLQTLVGLFEKQSTTAEAREEWAQAEVALVRLRSTYQRLGDRDGEARTSLRLGIAREHLDLPEKAEMSFRAVLEARSQLRNRRLVSRAMSELARLAQGEGAFEEARDLLLESLELVPQDEYRAEAVVSSRLAWVQKALGDTSGEEIALKRCLELNQRLGEHEYERECQERLEELYQRQVDRHPKGVDVHSTIAVLEKLAALQHATGNAEGLIQTRLELQQTYVRASTSCRDGGLMSEATELLEKAVTHQRSLDLTERVRKSLNALAQMYWEQVRDSRDQADLAGESQYLQRILGLNKELGDAKHALYVQKALARLYLSQANSAEKEGNLDLATLSLENRTDVLRELGNARLLKGALRRLVRLYLEQADAAQEMGRVDVVARSLEKRAVACREFGARRELAATNRRLVELYHRQADEAERTGAHNLAADLFRRCAETERELGRKGRLRETNWLFRKTLLTGAQRAREIGDLDGAAILFNRLLQRSLEVGDKAGAVKSKFQLAALRKDQGDFDAAQQQLAVVIEETSALQEWDTEGQARATLAEILRAAGTPERGEQLLLEHLEASRQRRDQSRIAAACARLAYHYQENQDLRRAADLRSQCLTINESLGNPEHTMKSLLQLEYLYSELDARAIEAGKTEESRHWRESFSEVREKLHRARAEVAPA